MLTELNVHNFALIERLTLDFGPGLNILTGETGAGKSILLDAIGAILGERARTDVIRTGADRASVEGAFSLHDAHGLLDRLAREGFDDEDGVLILARELAISGQGAARVNGRRTTVAQLRALGDGLVDLHGQHEHQTLLEVERHADILDAWGGETLLNARADVTTLYRAWQDHRAELAGLQMDERERARRLDLLAFQIEEIRAAGLQPGEESALLADRARLAGAERLAEAAAVAHAALATEGIGALDALGTALSAMRDAARIDPSLSDLLGAVETAFYGAQEAAGNLSSYVDSIEFNPERLAAVEERLDLLRRLKRKYGDTTDEVLAFYARAREEWAALEGAGQRTDELTGEVERLRTELERACQTLRAYRLDAAESLRRAIERELADLAMERTRFTARLTPTEPTARGADRVEFLIAPNPGEPLKPLARIASGGEISRLMLALKSVVAAADPVPVLIFDEIDSGVSGRQASIIARKMRALARCSQVLCVTHTPQIAAAADHHFVIRKALESQRAVTRVERVEGEARVAELARMLAGAAPTASAHAHARALISEATADGAV